MWVGLRGVINAEQRRERRKRRRGRVEKTLTQRIQRAQRREEEKGEEFFGEEKMGFWSGVLVWVAVWCWILEVYGFWDW